MPISSDQFFDQLRHINLANPLHLARKLRLDGYLCTHKHIVAKATPRPARVVWLKPKQPFQTMAGNRIPVPSLAPLTGRAPSLKHNAIV